MGTSTDGILMFGVAFDEGHEFPWNDSDGIESWWRKVGGYVPSVSPWTDKGDYAPGFTKNDPRIDQYFSEQHKWDKEHPIPIEVVNYCSGDYPIYALAVAGSVKVASRGYPKTIDPAELVCDPRPLIDFCANFGIEIDSNPAWLLASYWG